MLSNIVDIATKSLINKSDFIGGLNHSLEKGMHREYFVSEVLLPLLPHQFGITSGIIIDKNGRQSNQLDIIVFDKRKLPPLMMRDGAGVVPLDSALIVIEVKSKLTTTEIATCLSSAVKLNPTFSGHLEMTEQNLTSYYPLYAIFAYTSDAKEKSEYERVNDIYDGKISKEEIVSMYDQNSGAHVIPLISVLDKGFWAYTEVGGVKSELARPCEDKLINMRNFIWLLLDKVEDTARSRKDYKITQWFKLE
jgi:hypothetical protein